MSLKPWLKRCFFDAVGYHGQSKNAHHLTKRCPQIQPSVAPAVDTVIESLLDGYRTLQPQLGLHDRKRRRWCGFQPELPYDLTNVEAQGIVIDEHLGSDLLELRIGDGSANQWIWSENPDILA